MDKVKIKLIHCGNTNPARRADNINKNVFFMPMGTLPLASVLYDQGYDIEVIHSDLEKYANISDVIDLEAVDAVGFDCHWINQSVAVLETAQILKSINPDIFIFLGGFSASFFFLEILGKYKQIDAVIRGDGEVPIAELCSVLEAKKTGELYTRECFENALGKVQNLAWKTVDGIIRQNSFTYIGTTNQMDKLNYTSFELMRNWQYYRFFSKFWTRFEPINQSSVFFMEVGRGCQYACAFCGGNCEAQGIMNNRKGVVMRTPQSVIGTIKKAVDKGFYAFYFGFEYEGSDDWYIKLFDSVAVENLDIQIIYGCWRLPTKSLIDSLAKNFKHVILEISPETASNSLRNQSKDSRLAFTNKQLNECLDYINSKGNISVQLYFSYFQENDCKDTIFNTIRYILELLQKYPKILEIEYFNFSTDPGSLIYLHPDKFDINLETNSFESYLKYIRKHYTGNKAFLPEIRAFRPNSLSENDANILEGKIQLLNLLFTIYKKTMSYILKKAVGKELIMDFLTQRHIVIGPDMSVNIKSIKNELLKICDDKGILDIQMVELIYSESKNSSELNKEKSSPRIWVEVEDAFDEHQVDEETKEIIMFLNKQFEYLAVTNNLYVSFNL